MKYTAENVSHAIYCFLILGHSLDDIANRLGSSYGELKSELISYGIRPSDRGLYGDAYNQGKLTREITKRDIDEYVELQHKKLFKQAISKYLLKYAILKHTK